MIVNNYLKLTKNYQHIIITNQLKRLDSANFIYKLLYREVQNTFRRIKNIQFSGTVEK